MAAIGQPRTSSHSKFADMLGNEVTCTFGKTKTYRGNVSVFDGSLKAVLINSVTDDRVHLVNLHNVDRYEITKMSPHQDRYIFHPIDYTKLRQRFNKAVKKREDDLKRIGDGVSPFGQYLFDKLISVYSDTRWDSQVIVVTSLDIKIEPPYECNNVCIGKLPNAVERLKKMVDKARQEFVEQQPS